MKRTYNCVEWSIRIAFATMLRTEYGKKFTLDNMDTIKNCFINIYVCVCQIEQLVKPLDQTDADSDQDKHLPSWQHRSAH